MIPTEAQRAEARTRLWAVERWISSQVPGDAETLRVGLLAAVIAERDAERVAHAETRARMQGIIDFLDEQLGAAVAETKKAEAERDAARLNLDSLVGVCEVTRFSSRTCERGTRACTVHHRDPDVTLADLRERAAEWAVAFMVNVARGLNPGEPDVEEMLRSVGEGLAKELRTALPLRREA